MGSDPQALVCPLTLQMQALLDQHHTTIVNKGLSEAGAPVWHSMADPLLCCRHLLQHCGTRAFSGLKHKASATTDACSTEVAQPCRALQTAAGNLCKIYVSWFLIILSITLHA